MLGYSPYNFYVVSKMCFKLPEVATAYTHTHSPYFEYFCLSYFSPYIDSHDGMVNLFSIDETNFFKSGLQGLVASLLYMARCRYHLINLPWI